MQRHSFNATPPGKLVLNVEKLTELRRAHELESDSDFARFLGVERSTLYRITNGQAAPSNGFMARIKLAFPSVSLDSLFVVDRLVAV